MEKTDLLHNKGRKRKLFIALFIFLTLLALKAYLDLFSPNVVKVSEPKELAIYVNEHKQLSSVLFQLKQGQFLENQSSFERLANWVQLGDKLKSGKYILSPNMSNAAIIKMLFKGRQQPVDVVFKYAERTSEISAYFSKQLMMDSATLNSILSDTAYLHSIGFNSENILGLFIPNTYNFYWNTDVFSFLARMEKEYQSFWNEERINLANSLGLSQKEASTLASIVQKESNKIEEMSVIASVYLNRINLGMPLQADPTIIYAWNDKSIKRVTSLHTAIVSPYNTYTQLGLPPGPICTPSIQAINAVLHATKHKYLYFCAREDFSGYHTFAQTFAQHLQNASKYQRALNKRRVF